MEIGKNSNFRKTYFKMKNINAYRRHIFLCEFKIQSAELFKPSNGIIYYSELLGVS